MDDVIPIGKLWSDGAKILRHGWRSYFVAQLFFKSIAILLLGPLSVAVLNALLSESASIGNAALARFAFSPAGAIAIIILPSLALAELYFEQSMMIVLAHDACDQKRTSLKSALASTIRRTPRLALLALLQVVITIAILIPFLALAGLIYWMMLAGTDINFYLKNRPPVFIAAAAMVALIGLAAAAALLWFYIHTFLSVPVAIFLDKSARDSMRESRRLSKGGRHEVAKAAVSWLVIRFLAVGAGLMILRFVALSIASRSQGGLLATMWIIAGLIALTAAIFAVAAALDNAAIATLTALLYRRLVDPSAEIRIEPASAPRRRIHAILLVSVAAVALLVTATHTFVLIEQFTVRRRVAVTAHRAGALGAPENSLSALRKAIAAHADAAEIDVQHAFDGTLMVIHDRDLMRLAGEPMVVSESTAAKLATADIGKLFSPEFMGERIATLDQFIEESRGKIKLSIELKYYGRGDDTLAGAVVDTLKRKDFMDQANIISLEYRELERVRKIEPRLPLGFLVSASIGDITKLDVNFLSVAMRRFTPKLRRDADDRKIGIAVWTVNDRDSMIRMLARGADDLVTDDPALAVATVREYQDLSDIELILLRFREWMSD